jgi:hypothetical protein
MISIKENVAILFSIILVAAALLFFLNSRVKDVSSRSFRELDSLNFVNPNDSLHKAIAKDALQFYNPANAAGNDSIIHIIFDEYKDHYETFIYDAHNKSSLNMSIFLDIMGMYLKFLSIYMIVLLITFYLVETLGLLKFIYEKSHKIAYWKQLFELLKNGKQYISSQKIMPFGGRIFTLAAKIAFKGMAYLLLFSPAYIIAYSLKTDFNTDSFLFMILLGVVSNGMLILYTQKFYTFLKQEDRKGYVQTSIVKNMDRHFELKAKHAVSYKSVFKIKKVFNRHILNHIYQNAHYQYLPAIKEQASFLVSSLIIIEMALNIHGYLSYEMLRQILYANYDIVICIVLLIFFTVKLTDIVVDFVVLKNNKKFENK